MAQKRILSEEQKAKMKAGRDAAISRKLAAQESSPQVEKQTVTVDLEILQNLMAKVEALENNQTVKPSAEEQLTTSAQMQGVVTNTGVQGRVFKYPIEKSFYPDPTERLYDEPLLKRYNLRENFYFSWDVEGVEYEKYGITYAEPRFTVQLFRRIFDEDGITPSGQLALVNRAIQHEDEVVARKAAEKLGLTETLTDMRSLMDEMRYYRLRQWLMDLFTPVKVNHHNRQATQMVIDGKVVEVFDTEAIIDGETGKNQATTIASQVRI